MAHAPERHEPDIEKGTPPTRCRHHPRAGAGAVSGRSVPKQTSAQAQARVCVGAISS
jgi:hypothetical protein